MQTTIDLPLPDLLVDGEIVPPLSESDALAPWITDADIDIAESPRFQMLVALSATKAHVYGGTVPAHVIAKRRAKNKAARKARRSHR